MSSKQWRKDNPEKYRAQYTAYNRSKARERHCVYCKEDLRGTRCSKYCSRCRKAIVYPSILQDMKDAYAMKRERLKDPHYMEELRSKIMNDEVNSVWEESI